LQSNQIARPSVFVLSLFSFYESMIPHEASLQ
jgi:hypothetical protein